MYYERKAEGSYYICLCGQNLGSGKENFKNNCIVKESPVSELGPGFASSDLNMAKQMCFREFFCPGCGVRLATEVAQREDPFLWDIQIKI